ncbi:MAG: DivIVA domain-containing protein [Clostridia bacterium]|nr:DivIVA domain-containing protein [Clostridia bacterium]MBQ4605009.1 DivIVA domain-containing protein [Clostridia bacterium]
MLRTEQILNAKFTPVSKGTYNADEVDMFLKNVADSYEESLNQNKELIKKISILADKIESYRNDEEAIKLALLDAHRMAETINKNANTKADDILTDAETRSKIILDGATRQANQSIEEAREKAKEIVDNARTAVASLTERAQVETETTIKAAQKKAEEIVAKAQEEGKSIIGSSKESYEFYSSELAKVKAETFKFKETIQELCKGQLSLLDGMPEFIAAVNAVSAVAEQVPVEEDTVIQNDIEEIEEEVISDEIPEETVIDEQEEFVSDVAEVTTEEEIVIETDDDDSEPDIILPAETEEPVTFVPEVIAEPESDEDDLFSFIDDFKFDDVSDSISSDIDDLLPVIDDEDDDFDGFKIDLDSIEDINPDNSDDDDDITSLFDSMFDD